MTLAHRGKNGLCKPLLCVSTISCFGRIDKDVCFLHSLLSQYIIGDSQGKFVLFIKFKLKRRLNKESLLICVFTFLLVFLLFFWNAPKGFFFLFNKLPFAHKKCSHVFNLFFVFTMSFKWFIQPHWYYILRFFSNISEGLEVFDILSSFWQDSVLLCATLFRLFIKEYNSFTAKGKAIHGFLSDFEFYKCFYKYHLLYQYICD